MPQGYWYRFGESRPKESPGFLCSMQSAKFLGDIHFSWNKGCSVLQLYGIAHDIVEVLGKEPAYEKILRFEFQEDMHSDIRW